eukprot:5861745-Prorocentrum_lima.AAC.1
MAKIFSGGDTPLPIAPRDGNFNAGLKAAGFDLAFQDFNCLVMAMYIGSIHERLMSHWTHCCRGCHGHFFFP